MTPEEKADVRRAVVLLTVASQQLRQESHVLARRETGASRRLTFITNHLVGASDSLARHLSLDEEADRA